MFQIVIAIPYFDSYDSICGWHYRREPMAYFSPALPQKLCAMRNDGRDETNATVVPYGAIVDVLGRSMNYVSTLDSAPIGDDLPF